MSGGHKDSAEPDLTPILDMVFQLITFFMLVMNFKAAAYDLDLKLPVVGSALPVDSNSSMDILVLNIDKEGRLKLYKEAVDIPRYILSEAQAAVLAAKQKREYANIKYGDELPTIVVIRADAATQFRDVNRVIKECQDHGFRQFAMRAMDKVSGT
jgi:biopolymer transport protein ExbD